MRAATLGWFGLFLFLSAASFGQTTGPQSSTAPDIYNGQTVASIELVTDPHIDASSYRGVVRQQTGQPYSAKESQASMDALQQTHRFNKVEIEVKPQPNGLALRFVMEPAFYMGVVEFPGAVKNFSYTRLMQVANLPNEEPYDPKIPAGGRIALWIFPPHRLLRSPGQGRNSVR